MDINILYNKLVKLFICDKKYVNVERKYWSSKYRKFGFFCDLQIMWF